MQIEKLTMAPVNTTFMGVMMGAFAHYDIELSPAMVFGGSGHAFLINIHEQLCPSGPYCWNPRPMLPLVANLGLKVNDLGFFSLESTVEDRHLVEQQLRDALDDGIPCALMNMENQLITGYDADGFDTVQPWPGMDFPPARLSFGSWRELGDEIHLSFYTLEKLEPAAKVNTVLDSLDYAFDLHAHPENHSREPYGVGPAAYVRWIAAAAEHGGSHGNWWNATVWSECRRMASSYFAEIGPVYPQVAEAAAGLVCRYAEIADALERLSDKEMAADDKVALLNETREKEAQAVEIVATVAFALQPLRQEQAYA